MELLKFIFAFVAKMKSRPWFQSTGQQFSGYFNGVAAVSSLELIYTHALYVATVNYFALPYNINKYFAVFLMLIVAFANYNYLIKFGAGTKYMDNMASMSKARYGILKYLFIATSIVAVMLIFLLKPRLVAL